MNCVAVIGLGFGDEGKGLVTDYLCSRSPNPIVVRFSGGHQAGHTVVFNGLRHIFSNFGSGTLRGIPTYWSKYCTVEPIGLTNEFHILKKKGISPIIYIDRKCPVTTPYDIHQNHDLHEISKHGTCGVGFGATIQREENYYSLLFEDLYYPSILKIKLDAIQRYYGSHPDTDKFMSRIYEITQNSKIILSDGIPEYSDIIFEGSQGLLLDQNIGFFPHVTRANTGSKNLLTMGYSPELFLITRAYQTRHGNGPMTNENISHNISVNSKETNITNKYQGEFRRSLLDIDVLLYGISKDNYIRESPSRTLVITCVDHIKEEYKFTYKGEIVRCNNKSDFIEKISVLLNIKNVLISESDESKNIINYS